MPNIEKRSWKEFQDSGMLWWVNRVLHLFGWAIALNMDNGEVIEAFPARCKFRGFSEEDEDEGFQKVTKYLSENIRDLKEDTEQ